MLFASGENQFSLMTKKAFDSNTNIDEEVESDTDRAFEISIDASDRYCYDMVLLVRISTIDGSNYYEAIGEDSFLHLSIEVQHSSARCNNLSKKFISKMFLQNAVQLDMSLIPVKPELLPPIVKNGQRKFVSTSKAGKPTELFRLVQSQQALLHYTLRCAGQHVLNIHCIDFTPNKNALRIQPNTKKIDYSVGKPNAMQLNVNDANSNCFGFQPLKHGPSVSMGTVHISWSRSSVMEKSLMETLESDQDGSSESGARSNICVSSYALPETLVYPLQKVSVDIKTSTDVATYCTPFDLKLYLINNTVSSENISVEMSANENFLIAGRMVGKFCVQPMSTIAITYVLTGIEIGLLALPQIEIKSISSGEYLIDNRKNSGNKRHVYVKPR